jgi:hypothetical protein
LRKTHVRGVCRSDKLSLPRDVLEDFGIPKFGQLLHAQTEEDRVHEVRGLVFGYDQNVLLNWILIKLQNELLYYHQPFHNPTFVEHLGLYCKVHQQNVF